MGNCNFYAMSELQVDTIDRNAAILAVRHAINEVTPESIHNAINWVAQNRARQIYAAFLGGECVVEEFIVVVVFLFAFQLRLIRFILPIFSH